MAGNGRLSGGVESTLGTLLDSPDEAGEGSRPLPPPRDMHRIILQTLVAHGMHATAECLRSEAPDLGDLPLAAAAEKPAALACSAARGSARAGFRERPPGPPGVHLANDERVRAERAKVAACFEVVAEQRRRLDSLRSTVQQLRESRCSGTAVSAQAAALAPAASAAAEAAAQRHSSSRRVEDLRLDIEQLRDMELRTREELQSKLQEAAILRELLSTKMSAETDLQQRVQRAKEEVARLLREKGS